MKLFCSCNKLFTRILLIALFLGSISEITMAANGKITGKVTDSQTGEALISVNVVVVAQVLSDGKVVPMEHPIGAATDIDGNYFILNISPGTYNVRASIIGYAAVTITDVEVGLDRTVRLDFNLAPKTIEVGQVVITAKKEIIKQDVSATQEVIESKRLAEMPVTRVDEFLGTVKGIQLVSNAEGNGLSIRGGSIRETDVRLDGLSLRDPRTDNSYLALNTTTISEIQVLTGGFEAKYGGIQAGLLNVVTKNGSRERFTASIRTDIAPANQARFFGTNPWSNDSWIYKVFAGEYAMHGVPADDPNVPEEFKSFKGWTNPLAWGDPNVPSKALDSLQKLDLWKAQHPQYNFGDKPDMFIEGSFTGPLPGGSIPIFGDYAKNTTFLFGFKYENSQLAFPIGPRNNYIDWNTQIKLTTKLPNQIKLSVNAMYANINSVGGGATTNYGGALADQSTSYNYFNSTPSSVSRQASYLGGGGFYQLFNKSRFQYYQQRYILGGARLTQTISPKAFYTIELNMGFTDQNLEPFAMDTSIQNHYYYLYSQAAKKTYKFLLPDFGSPNASTNFGYDAYNMFAMYGGAQRVDSSHSYTFQLKGDLTAQVGLHHQIDAGFTAELQDMFVYTGTWFQSELSFSPDTWQYYKATPLTVGLYAQDKIEFQGMILNAGLRVDYLNPMKKSFKVGFPLSDNYKDLWNDIYPNLAGDAYSYERWLEYRGLLDNPPGWPETEDKVQIYLSPRLGVSFPISESSKMYFNYGHFYQRPATSFMYNLYVTQGGVALPSPNLKMAETVSYEFGFEQMILNDFLVNITAYYKDMKNLPLSRTYVNYFEDNRVTIYSPDGYRDIRGVEVRLEKPVGRFVTFNAMYDYMLQSSGQIGIAELYENQVKYRQSLLRSPNISSSEPQPRAVINLNLHTPDDFGPKIIGHKWLSGWQANFFFKWNDGGRILLNPEEVDIKKRYYADVVNYWNINMLLSKRVTTSFGSIEFVLTVQNLTNNKFLNPNNMTQTQFSEYKSSLNTPDKGGSDLWGQYKSDDNHIKTGWFDAPIFLNPRRFLLGLRLNF